MLLSLLFYSNALGGTVYNNFISVHSLNNSISENKTDLDLDSVLHEPLDWPVDAPVVGEDVDDLVVARVLAGAPFLQLHSRSHRVPDQSKEVIVMNG